MFWNIEGEKCLLCKEVKYKNNTITINDFNYNIDTKTLFPGKEVPLSIIEEEFKKNFAGCAVSLCRARMLLKLLCRECKKFVDIEDMVIERGVIRHKVCRNVLSQRCRNDYLNKRRKNFFKRLEELSI